MTESSSNAKGREQDERFLTETFDTWRAEFRNILEDHRREIQNRLEKIEREIEKKSDKENVDLLARSIREENQHIIRPHCQAQPSCGNWNRTGRDQRVRVRPDRTPAQHNRHIATNEIDIGQGSTQ